MFTIIFFYFSETSLEDALFLVDNSFPLLAMFHGSKY